MRVPVLVYVLLYLVVELIGTQLATVEWQHITPLMVASAVTDASLVVSVLVAALVTAELTGDRWRPSLHAWLHEHARPHAGWWGAHGRPHRDGRHGRHGRDGRDGRDGEVLDVRSWRPDPLALPVGPPAAAPTATYAAPTYAAGGTPARTGRPFPEDDGRLL